MEEGPHNKDIRLNEDGEIVRLDDIAREGFLKKDDIPGSDLFDQHGDLTNVTGSADTNDAASGPKDRTRRGDNLYAGSEGVAGLNVRSELEEGDDLAGDAADRWLKANDPEYGKEDNN